MARTRKGKTLRGGLLGIVSLRKKISTQPSQYKKILTEYLGSTIRSVGKRPLTLEEYPLVRRQATPDYRDLNKVTVKGAWEDVVKAYKALSDKEVLEGRHVKAELNGVQDPRMKAAILSGATAGAMTTLGVAGKVVAQTGLFVGTVLCGSTVLALGGAVFLLELATFFGGGAFIGSDFSASSGVFSGISGCNMMRGGGSATAEEKAAAEKERQNKDSSIQESLVDAAQALLPLQKAYDEALAKGISAIQDVYGDANWGEANSSVMVQEIHSFPEFPVVNISLQDLPTAMALAATAAAATPEAHPNPTEDTPEANKAAAAAIVKTPEAAPEPARPNNVNQKAPPPRKALLPPTKAPEPAACWTSSEPEGDGVKAWTHTDGRFEWGTGDKGIDTPDGGPKCPGNGGRKRRVRGGGPSGVKPTPTGGRRTRRRQPRRKTSRRKQ